MDYDAGYETGLLAGKEISEDAIQLLREIGSGPGYPLDDCPKCEAAKKARDFVNEHIDKKG